ncbi:endonuclease [Bacillus safensis FO-36b] [Bacillus safensis subsp. safensis]
MTVTGKITSYKGLIEIVPDRDALEVDAVNQTLPKPRLTFLTETTRNGSGT